MKTSAPFVMLLMGFALVLAACSDSGPSSAGSITMAPVESTTSDDRSTTTTSTSAGVRQGSENSTTAPVAEDPEPMNVEVFFVKDGQYAQSVTRSVEGPPATGALEALLAGPTSAEAESGLASVVPNDTLVLGMTIRDGVATVDLSREFEAGGGSFSVTARLAQVVYTLTQFPTVDRVMFHLDGAPVTVFSSEGVTLDGPVGRDAFLDSLPIGPARQQSDVARWDEDVLPSVQGTPVEQRARVVLVADGDVLNVRTGPGVRYPILGGLVPGVVVGRTGEEHQEGASTWAEVEALGRGWVNGLFLTAVVDPDDFAADPEVRRVLDELAAVMDRRGDLGPVASWRGIYVSHHATPVRHPRPDLSTLLTDPTTAKWPSPALDVSDPSQAAELPDETFAQAVADSFVDVWGDADVRLAFNQPLTGGNGRIDAAAIPSDLQGFNYVAVHDPGDDPQFDGLDWVTWYVSFDFDEGEPRVVGLTIDEWAP